MINTSEIHSVDDEASQSDANNTFRKYISNAPLLAVGTAVGAGVVAWLLFGPRIKRERNLVDKVMKNIHGISGGISGISPHKKVGRDFKAAVGTLALHYLSRKLKSKLHIR